MRITLLNNIKVLGVFSVYGIFSLLYMGLLMVNAEKYRITVLSEILVILFIPIFLGGHYLSGKYFFRSTSNLFLDSASFIVIIILAILCAIFARDFTLHPLSILFSPKLFLEQLLESQVGTKYEIISLFTTVFLSILMQFLGMVKNVKIQ